MRPFERDHSSLKKELWLHTSYRHGAFDGHLIIMRVYGIECLKGMNIRFRQHSTSVEVWGDLFKMAATKHPGNHGKCKMWRYITHYAISSDKKSLLCKMSSGSRVHTHGMKCVTLVTSELGNSVQMSLFPGGCRFVKLTADTNCDIQSDISTNVHNV